MEKWMWVALALAGACKGEPRVEEPRRPPSPAPAAGLEPRSTRELDALWALAPETARFGVVIAPRGLATLERAYAILDGITTAPQLADAKAQVKTTLAEVFGAPAFAFASAGMSTTRGWAYFQLDDDAITILPVVDRARFLAAHQGTTGAEGRDTFGGQTCKLVKGVYACARSPSHLEDLGDGILPEVLKLAGARGEVEIAGAIPPLGMGAAVIQLEGGTVTLRGALAGLTGRSKQVLANVHPRPVDATHSSFGALGVGRWELLQKIPNTPLVEGVTADALARSLVGPVTLTGTNGAAMLDVQIALDDPAPAQKLVALCDRIPFLGRLGAAVKDGTCHLTLPQVDLPIETWVDGKTLHIGKRGAAATRPPAVPLSPLANELAREAWAVALYGRGSMFGPSLFELPIADGVRERVGARMFALINELGIGIRRDDDAVRLVAGVRTIWSNPDDVVAKLLAIDPDAIENGTAAKLAKPIADAAPRSPFAADYQLGSAGLLVGTGMMGLLFSVGIPAFADTLNAERKPEAVSELERIGDTAATVRAAKGSFPKGKVGPTPAKTCCGTGNNRCVPDPAAWSVPLWKTLGFAMTEPHLFRYAYESTDGRTFTVTARSDLDCNGDEAVWTLTGKIDANGKAITDLVPPAKGHY